ncbi:sulfite exporter TauE/SafE family protein [Rufibacter soli]
MLATSYPTLLLVVSFFLVATLYSSVGFGGGSSYLALLALFLPNFLEIKSMALLCNLMVVSGGSYLFYKEGLLNFKKFFPIVVLSIPAAFWGATLTLSQALFFISLGLVLCLSGALLLFQYFKPPVNSTQPRKTSTIVDMGLGAATGFVSGLVGIGGGILLSPTLHLLKWAQPRTIAALASFFILVNSVSGLLGQVVSGTFQVDGWLLGPLLLAVWVGGQLGTRWNLKLLPPRAIKGLTGIFVLVIGLKLVLDFS